MSAQQAMLASLPVPSAKHFAAVTADNARAKTAHVSRRANRAARLVIDLIFDLLTGKVKWPPVVAASAGHVEMLRVYGDTPSASRNADASRPGTRSRSQVRTASFQCCPAGSTS